MSSPSTVRPISAVSPSCTFSALAVTVGTITGRMVMDWLAVYCFRTLTFDGAGDYILTAIAKDAQGREFSSEPVTIRVIPNLPLSLRANLKRQGGGVFLPQLIRDGGGEDVCPGPVKGERTAV